ncbi:Cell wall protein 1 [Escovopsis weberi]|uniref:Cell wall protein 1 n=1 Tax=Escovopsis weberi TaxID=150374 RepID=A0A0M8MU19_ESCWE|nr:Cell wall protein 1 [Escovopsis weberi]
MKLSALVSLAVAVIGASAAVTDGLPSCAKSCVNDYVGVGSTSIIAGCKALDVACICSNSNFISDLSCCLSDACGEADQKAAVEFAAQICSSAGVKTPNQVVCDKKPANATSTAGPTAGSGKPAANTTATGGSAKPTSGASSVLVGAGGVIGAAAAALMLAM